MWLFFNPAIEVVTFRLRGCSEFIKKKGVQKVVPLPKDRFLVCA